MFFAVLIRRKSPVGSECKIYELCGCCIDQERTIWHPRDNLHTSLGLQLNPADHIDPPGAPDTNLGHVDSPNQANAVLAQARNQRSIWVPDDVHNAVTMACKHIHEADVSGGAGACEEVLEIHDVLVDDAVVVSCDNRQLSREANGYWKGR